MSMATIHISEADALRDLPGVLARVRAGAEVVIEDPASPAVVLRTAVEPSVRRLSESLRLAREQRVPVLAAIPATAGLPSTVMARRKQCAPRARGRPRASRRSPPQDRP